MAENDLKNEEVGQLLVCLVAKLHTQIPPNLWNLDGGGFFFVANLSRRLPSWTVFLLATARRKSHQLFGAILFPATKTPHKKGNRTITTM